MLRILLICLVIAFSNISFAEWEFTAHGQGVPLCFTADSSGLKLTVGMYGCGYWQTQDGGQTWIPINELVSPSLGVGPVAVESGNPLADTLVARLAQWDPLEVRTHRYSLNGGITWNEYGYAEGWPYHLPDYGKDYLKIFRSPSTKVIIARDGGFAYSDDSGDTWAYSDYNPITRGIDGCLVNPVNPDTIYAYGSWGTESLSDPTPSGGIIASYDEGITWQRITPMETLDPDGVGVIIDLDRISDSMLIATTVWNQQRAFELFLVSNDNGSTWEWREASGLPSEFLSCALTVVSEIPGRLVLSSTFETGVFISDDYGYTWERVFNGLPINPQSSRLYRNPYSGHLYALLYNYGIYKSIDFGDSWFQIPSPPIGNMSYRWNGLCADVEGLLQSDYGGSLWYAPGASATFTRPEIDLIPGEYTICTPISITEDHIRYFMIRNDMYSGDHIQSIVTSSDNGQSWIHSTEVSFDTEYIHYVEEIETVSDTLFMAMGEAGEALYFSDDVGESWIRRDPGFIYTKPQYINGSIYTYDLWASGMFRSDDLGESWIDLEHPNPQGLVYTYCDILTLNDTLYSSSMLDVWVKPPHESWQQRSSVPNEYPQINWELVTTEEDTFLVAGDKYNVNMLLVSYNMGHSWLSNPLQIPWIKQGLTVFGLEYDPYRERLWVDTGAGLAYFDFTENSVHDPWVLQPATFATMNAYPNPFNASTTISYSINTPQTVKLEVYDLLGRHVATLADGLRTPGSHTAFFDAATYASGTYFLRLSTDENTLNRKLVLMK